MNPTTLPLPTSPPLEPTFERERHIKYHLRCLKTLLPTQYTSNDSNRMLLAFLTLNALDLLSALDTSHLSDEERQCHIDWIYRCQLSSGGFRGFTGADPGTTWRKQRQVESGGPEVAWDPANLAGTFFALVSLIVLGDDLGRVRRRETLTWLRHLQWEKDGSFGEVLGSEGRPEGERDIRFCYMAAAIRHMLRCQGDIDVPDLDVETLSQFVLSSQVRFTVRGCAARRLI
jgi:geranylgeranyl transferase type-1 subunit beta